MQRVETTNNREKYRKTSHLDFENTYLTLENHSIFYQPAIKLIKQPYSPALNKILWFYVFLVRYAGIK